MSKAISRYFLIWIPVGSVTGGTTMLGLQNGDGPDMRLLAYREIGAPWRMHRKKEIGDWKTRLDKKERKKATEISKEAAAMILFEAEE